ncbi:hypothetical protein [Plantactinospora sonchi]|uniref:DUF2062 domain-containing protein n=1 Tax=Plantactinospora sonchi TaxID=1544735 RepID=A0ABU7RQM8_9ACTN
MTIRLRHLAELIAPGAGIGAVAGVAAVGLALAAGQPVGWALATGFGLGLPMVLAGAGFGLLLANGILSPGVFAPTALFWLVAFPLTRLSHEVLAGLLIAGRPALPPDVFGFLVYQALISVGFAIGFSWLHERIAPHWFRRIQHHNPRAERLYLFYLRHAEAQWKARESRRRARATARATGRPALSRTGPKE